MGAEAIFSDDLLVLCVRGIHHSNIVRTSTKWSSRSIHDVINLENELFSLLPPEHTHLKGDRNEDNDNFEQFQLLFDEDPIEKLAFVMAGGACYDTDEVGLENLYIFAPSRSIAWCEKSWKSNPLFAEFIRMGEGRRNFLTSSGNLGFGREDLEVGDIVCVLFGCSVPVVLRKMNGYYNFLRECYVHGILEGEVVGALEKGEVESQLFSIR